jgi:hypothetical protein
MGDARKKCCQWFLLLLLCNVIYLDKDCWRCPPGEAHASQFGLKYCVRTDAELNPVFTQNLIFLEDYYGNKSSLTTFYERAN